MLVDLPFILSMRVTFPIGNTRVNRVRSVETATDLIPQIAAQVRVWPVRRADSQQAR